MSGGQDKVCGQTQVGMAESMIDEVREHIESQREKLGIMTTDRDYYRGLAERYRIQLTAVSESQIGAWNRGFMYGAAAGAVLTVVFRFLLFVIVG
jgi:hypothetical protein